MQIQHKKTHLDFFFLQSVTLLVNVFVSKLVTGLGRLEGEQVKAKEQNRTDGCFEDVSEKKGNYHVMG